MSKILMTSQIVGDTRVKTSDTWNEADHPRADNGQFGSGGGGAKKAAPKAKAAAKSASSNGGSATQKALAKREKGGFNPKEGEALLTEILNDFSPKHWAMALAYNGFCTNATAEKLAAELLAERGAGSWNEAGTRKVSSEKPAEKPAEKKTDMKRWMKAYERREDNNYHAENALAVAKLVGTPEDIKEITDINKRHIKNGSLDYDDYQKRSAIQARLWPKVKALMGE